MSLLNKIFLFILIISTLFITIVLNVILENERTSRFEILNNKKASNEQVYKKIISSLLFDLNKTNISITLKSLYQDEDIVEINLIDYARVIELKLDEKNKEKEKQLKSVILLVDDEIVMGELHIVYTTKNIEDFINAYKNKIIITSISLMFILLVIIFYYINYVTWSLKKLTQVAKQIEEGNLTSPIDIKSSDEIGELAKRIIYMRDSLRNKISFISNQLTFQRTLMDTVNIAIYIKDENKRFIDCNKAFTQLVGMTKESIQGKSVKELRYDEFTDIYDDSDNKVLNGEKEINYRTKMYDGKNRLREIVSYKNCYKKDNKLAGIIGTIVDITDLEQAKEKVNIFSQAIEQSPISIIITDTNGNIEYVNKYFKKITGYSLDEVKGKNPNILKSNATSLRTYKEIWNCLLNNKIWEGELQNKKKNGQLYWEYAYFSSILDEKGEIINFLAVKEDITIKKEQEEKLQYQAHYDMLTDLPNRSLFNDRLKQLIKESKRSNQIFAVLFIDLDNFKKINDTLGHHFGDKVLVQAAKRLKKVLREEDTISRFGGDEFIILLPNFKKLSDVSKIVKEILHMFSKPFIVDENKIPITTSIGVTTSLDSQESKIEDFLRNADIAMYKAKENGKNTFVYFNEELHNKLLRSIKIEEEMTDALKRKEFEVFFQAKVDIKTLNILGAEALIRWNNKNLDFISPEEFIPIAEQNGLITQIGQFVISQSIKLIAKIKKKFGFDLCIAVNVSPLQLLDDSIVDFIKNELKKYNVDTKLLEIEITEGVLMNKDDKVEEILESFKDLGLSIALDDFGTGYSSLSYLRKYPFDIIKIDKSFIDAHDYTLVNTIISMSKIMNLKVVAEGVETKEQLDKLNELDCDIAQGYYFSKPIPKKRFLKFIKSDYL